MDLSYFCWNGKQICRRVVGVLPGITSVWCIFLYFTSEKYRLLRLVFKTYSYSAVVRSKGQWYRKRKPLFRYLAANIFEHHSFHIQYRSQSARSITNRQRCVYKSTGSLGVIKMSTGPMPHPTTFLSITTRKVGFFRAFPNIVGLLIQPCIAVYLLIYESYTLNQYWSLYSHVRVLWRRE